jgi:hypothetical protein
MACSWAEEDLIWDGVPVHRGECMHCRKLLIYLAYLGCLLHCLTAHVPMHARVLCLPSTVSVPKLLGWQLWVVNGAAESMFIQETNQPRLLKFKEVRLSAFTLRK